MDVQVSLPGSDFGRCFGGVRCLQLVTRLQAIQLYPYHPGLKALVLLNGFAVSPFF